MPRIDHAQEDYGIHFQRNVIASDDVLRRDFQRFLPQRNAHDAVDRRENQNHSRPFSFGQQASQAKDYAALIFGQNLDGIEDVDRKDDTDHEERAETQT